MKLTPRRILIAGWLGFLLYAYPGYMHADGADQLVDSRVGAFTDWNSPMMTEVWRVVGRVISGPAGMLLLQSLLLLGGSYCLLRRALSDRAAAIAAICVLLAPPIMATSAVICVEAQVASFLVAAIAALASPRPRIRWLGLGLLFVACGMGGSLAALPIAIAFVRWRDTDPPWRRRALAVITWLGLALAAAGVDHVLVDARTHREPVARAMTDIAGTIRYAGALSDAELRPLLDGVPLASPDPGIQAHARAAKTKPMTFYVAPTTPEQRDAILAAHWAVARAAPGAYLHERTTVLLHVLGLRRPSSWAPAYTEFVASVGDRAGLRHAAWHSVLQSWLIRPVRALSNTLLFRPLIYAILALVLLPVAIAWRRRDSVMLLASGVLYELTLMFDATRIEYRDSHWLVVATVLAAILLKPRDKRVGDEAALAVARDDHL